MQRFLIPLDEGELTPDQTCLALNAQADPVLRQLPGITCQQTFRPDFNALEAAGHTAVTEANGPFDAVLVRIGRHKDQNRLAIANAFLAARPEGTIFVSGNKTDGIESLAKELKRAGLSLAVRSKSHGKVFWLQRPAPLPDFHGDWLALGEMRPVEGGYQTTPAAFSSDGIDEGSRLLAGHFDPKLKGYAADFGAGWGYLSHRLLAACPKIAQVEVIEAEATALAAARANIKDTRAVFHWQDVRDQPPRGVQYDLVVTNPPFHTGRQADHALGAMFIERAAASLRPKGRLLLVANRHLPYETVLRARFRTVQSLEETPRFKVYSAMHPITTTRGR